MGTFLIKILLFPKYAVDYHTTLTLVISYLSPSKGAE